MWPNATFVFIFDSTPSPVSVRPPQLDVEAPAEAPAVLVKAPTSMHWKVWKTKWFLMLFSDWIGMKMNSWKKRAKIHENDCNNVMHSLLCVDRSDTSWWLFSSHQFSFFFLFFFGSEKSKDYPFFCSMQSDNSFSLMLSFNLQKYYSSCLWRSSLWGQNLLK